MPDQPTKLSEFPVANSVIDANVRFVILEIYPTYANNKTISTGTLLNTLFVQAPTYANNSAAIAGGLANGAVYATSNGEVRVVV